MSKKVVITQLNELELVRDYLNGDMEKMNGGNSNMTNDEVMAKARQIRIRAGLLERTTEAIKSFNPDPTSSSEKKAEYHNNNNEENE